MYTKFFHLLLCGSGWTSKCKVVWCKVMVWYWVVSLKIPLFISMGAFVYSLDILYSFGLYGVLLEGVAPIKSFFWLFILVVVDVGSL